MTAVTALTLSRQVDARYARTVLYSVHPPYIRSLLLRDQRLGRKNIDIPPNLVRLRLTCLIGCKEKKKEKSPLEYLGTDIPFVIIATAPALLVETVSKRFYLNILEAFQNNHPKASHINWCLVLEQSKKNNFVET